MCTIVLGARWQLRVALLLRVGAQDSIRVRWPPPAAPGAQSTKDPALLRLTVRMRSRVARTATRVSPEDHASSEGMLCVRVFRYARRTERITQRDIFFSEI